MDIVAYWQQHCAPYIRAKFGRDERGASLVEYALLVVSDDGHGFPIGKAGRLDSYGMLGMRERADAIGAVLEFESAQGRGTTVRCRLENDE